MKKQANWSIIGHESVLGVLDVFLEQENLSAHAFLFYGQKHVGKTTVATAFIQKLLGLELGQKIWQHPDVHLLERATDKTEIVIEQIRVWQKELSLKPFSGAYKIGVIAGAEDLNQEASNALLKILEEPAGQTVFIVISHRWQKLLPTIKSRLQPLAFGPVATQKIIAGLQRIGVEAEKAKLLAAQAAWRPGLAMAALTVDSDLSEQGKKFNQLTNLAAADWVQRWNFLSSHSETDSSGVKEQLSWCEAWLHHSLANKKLSNLKFIKIADNLRWSKTLLQQNVTPKLIWEYLIINL